MKKEKIDRIIKGYGGSKRALIAILQDLQARYNWLPPESLRSVAKGLSLPLIDVYSTATFYRTFSLKPRGKHLITVCLGTACHVRGAPRVLEELQKKLDIRVGETTKDGLFTLETVRCLGCCALGPIVVVDDEYHDQMTKMGVDTLLSEFRGTEREKEDG